jgi:hypothetical protein
MCEALSSNPTRHTHTHKHTHTHTHTHTRENAVYQETLRSVQRTGTGELNSSAFQT